VRGAATVEEFFADPVGAYVAGRSFVIWAFSPTLAGSIYFGQPEASDYPALLRMFELPRHPRLQRPFDVLVDAGDVEGLSASAFELLTTNLAVVEGFSAFIRRVSIVRPRGVAGAAVAGLFYEAVQGRFTAALFTDRKEALGWLGRADRDQAQAALQAVIDRVRGTSPSLRALRDHLARHIAAPSIDEAARALVTSPRSLQRRLAELGTSFRAEVDRARACVAEALLAEPGLKLETIAERVGCSSASHFTKLFRRLTGESPSDFRARRPRS
jgi:AraC-like DNA-binding protein